VQEHEAILNALLRRDGAALSHVLRRHLRHKREAVERAGFAESVEEAGGGQGEETVPRRRSRATLFDVKPTPSKRAAG
jgi:hypothetical protein